MKESRTKRKRRCIWFNYLPNARRAEEMAEDAAMTKTRKGFVGMGFTHEPPVLLKKRLPSFNKVRYN